MVQSHEYTIAVHEAGHAVMAVLLGKDVNRVTVLPKDNTLGECEHSNNITKENNSEEAIGLMLQSEILILIAGTTAEAVILKISPIHSRGKDDYERVNALLEAPNDGLAKERSDFIHDRAYKLFRNPAVQQQIIAVADALMAYKTLSGVQVNEIIKRIG